MSPEAEEAISLLRAALEREQRRAHEAELRAALGSLTERVLRLAVEEAELRALQARAELERERAARALERLDRVA